MPSCYTDALRMLARRELSEAQVRQRLHRRGHSDDEIDGAVRRLTSERAIDDWRVAEAIARNETSVKRRGKLRVVRQIESAGIAKSVARRATDEAFSDIDHDALIEAALARRLRGSAAVQDEKHFQRLYRYLIGQGYEADQVMRVLTARRKKPRIDVDDLE